MGMHTGEPNSGFGVRKASTKEKKPLLNQERPRVRITKEENGIGSMISGRGSRESKCLKLGERELGGCTQFSVAGARPEVA